MDKILVVGILMVGAMARAYPTSDDQDYLLKMYQMAAQKGENLLDYNGDQDYVPRRPGQAQPDLFDILYDTDSKYPRQWKEWAYGEAERLMNKGGNNYPMYEQEADEQEELEDEIFDGKLEVEEDWPVQPVKLGQVGGVAVCPEGFPHVFHRADRVWDEEHNPFDPETDEFTDKEKGAITEAPIARLNASNGVVLDKWGEGIFYMPHGLTIDSQGNYWLTDVALHQVFKFNGGEKTPSMTLGKAFEPAKDNTDTERFCKPTDVAVASNGDFFVADGYCNQRIIKYSAAGEFIGAFGMDHLDVPHSVALVEDKDQICVADRENERIVCYNAGLNDGDKLGEQGVSFEESDVLGRVFAITYSQNDGLIYAVGTGEAGENSPQGFSIDVSENSRFYSDIINNWSPKDKGFEATPHDVAVSPDGTAVYVGLVEVATEDDSNVFKFVKADQEEEEEEEEEELGEEHDEDVSEDEEDGSDEADLEKEEINLNKAVGKNN